MQNYAPNTAVPVTFRLLNEAGDVLEPTGLRWRVLDEDDQPLLGWTTLTLPSPPEDQITLTLSPALTAIAAGQGRGLRTVELEVVSAVGTLLLSERVLLTAVTVLAPGVNSFISYSRAVLTAEDFTESTMAGWVRQSRREERERALIEAYLSILQMPIHIRSNLGLVAFIEKFGNVELGEALQVALRRAQVLEASEILNADPAVTARRNGLISMTVGESSQFYGTSKPLNMPLLSAQAVKTLSPWLNYSVRTGRAR